MIGAQQRLVGRIPVDGIGTDVDDENFLVYAKSLKKRGRSRGSHHEPITD
jgi:hypothetical protein